MLLNCCCVLTYETPKNQYMRQISIKWLFTLFIANILLKKVTILFFIFLILFTAYFFEMGFVQFNSFTIWALEISCKGEQEINIKNSEGSGMCSIVLNEIKFQLQIIQMMRSIVTKKIIKIINTKFCC